MLLNVFLTIPAVNPIKENKRLKSILVIYVYLLHSLDLI